MSLVSDDLGSFDENWPGIECPSVVICLRFFRELTGARVHRISMIYQCYDELDCLAELVFVRSLH